MHRMALLTVIALLGVSAGHSSSSDWAINATAIEACSCPHFCMCYFNAHPAAHNESGKTEHYCKFNNAYKVNKGHYGNIDLSGTKFWLSGDLGGDCSQGQMNWVVATFDKRTTAEQRTNPVVREKQPCNVPAMPPHTSSAESKNCSNRSPTRSRLKVFRLARVKEVLVSRASGGRNLVHYSKESPE